MNQVCHIKRSHCLCKPKNYGLRFQSFYALSVYVSGKENFLCGSVSMILVFYIFLVSHLEPYNQKQPDSGRVWTVIAENLNTNGQHHFKTTDRLCRDRFNKLMEEFEKTRKTQELMPNMMKSCGCVETSKNELRRVEN